MAHMKMGLKDGSAAELPLVKSVWCSCPETAASV